MLTGGYFVGGKFFDKDGNQLDDKAVKDAGLTNYKCNKIDEKVITGE